LKKLKDCRICAATLGYRKEGEVMEDGLRLGFWTMGLMRSMEWRMGGEGRGRNETGEICMQATCPKPGRQGSSQRMMDKPRNERRDLTSSTSFNIRHGSITWIIVFIFGARI